jgi:acetyl-CoA carboxylase biotin carboxyl carrier protein
MEFKQIQDLIKLVNRLELTEFKMRDGDFELSIRTKRYDKTKQIVTTSPQVVPVQQPAAPSPQAGEKQEQASEQDSGAEQPSQAPAPDQDEGNLLAIKSPIVGTFYRSPAPDKPPYVKVGDVVEQGNIVCIVEAMKLFNEIESEVSGKIVKVAVEDATPVEFDQVLFLVDPNT